MAKTHQRVFALLLAFMFLATTVATGVVVIWQIREDNKSKQASADTQTDSAQDQTNTETGQENMLKGTSLANFTPQGETTTLQKTDLIEGTGAVVEPGATVTVHYTGAYASNGEIFESSKDSGEPLSFPLGNVIPGWQEGVPGMKVGGTRRLVIPGELAYGVAPEGYKPGDGGRPMGTLVFDIELIKIGE